MKNKINKTLFQLLEAFFIIMTTFNTKYENVKDIYKLS